MHVCYVIPSRQQGARAWASWPIARRERPLASTAEERRHFQMSSLITLTEKMKALVRQ